MARDGNGDYTLPVAPFVNGQVADADDVNSNFDDVKDALSDSINKAGTKAMAADLPMGGNKITGLAASTGNGEAVRHEQLTGLSATYQPLDADLTAIAALGYTSGAYLIKKTAANTYSIIAVTANAELLLADTNVPRLGAANTFTGGVQTVSGSGSSKLKLERTSNNAVLDVFQDSDSTYFDASNANATMIFRQNAVTQFTITGTHATFVNDLRIPLAPSSIDTTSVGYRGAPLSRAVTSSITLALGDSGRHISIAMASGSQTVTIPPNSSVAFPIGTLILLRVGGGNTFTVVEGAGVTLSRSDGTAGTGTRTVTSSSMVSLFKGDTNAWEIGGAYT